MHSNAERWNEARILGLRKIMKTETLFLDEFTVTFRYVGDQVDPKLITSIIGIQPSRAHVKGEIVEKHPQHVYPTGYWGIDSSVQPNKLIGEHLEQLLDKLESKSLEIKQLADLGLLPQFYCGYFTPKTRVSIKFELEILRRITELGASLDCRVYSHFEDVGVSE